MTVHLELPEPPSANRYWRRAGTTIYVSDEAKQYRQDVMARYLTKHGGKIAFPTGAIEVRLEWHRARRQGDLDNRVKCALDALRRLAYTDDKQIAAITAVRYEAPRNGKLVVWVNKYDA